MYIIITLHSDIHHPGCKQLLMLIYIAVFSREWATSQRHSIDVGIHWHLTKKATTETVKQTDIVLRIMNTHGQVE